VSQSIVFVSWPEERNCKGASTQEFFPERNITPPIHLLEKCDQCVCASKCAEYAIDNDEIFGYWGGLSRQDRARVIIARGLKRAFRKKPTNFVKEIPSCELGEGPSAEGFVAHLDRGEIPCVGCRTKYRIYQRRKYAVSIIRHKQER